MPPPDNGKPALAATRYFTVVVDDVLPDFEFVVGRDWARAGTDADIPLVIDTLQPLASVQLEVELLGNPIAPPSLESLAAALTGATIQPLAPDRFLLVFQTGPSAPLLGRQTLARLKFVTPANADSAYVRIRAGAVTGIRPAGGDPAHGRATHGRLVILGPQPVLEAETDGSQHRLRLFAEPGTPTRIERQLELAPGESWEEVRSLIPTAVETTLDDLTPEGFYRARYGAAAAPVLRIRFRPDGRLEIEAAGSASGTWILEQSEALGTEGTWTQAAVADLGTGLWTWLVPADAGTVPTRLYRLRRTGGP